MNIANSAAKPVRSVMLIPFLFNPVTFYSSTTNSNIRKEVTKNTTSNKIRIFNQFEYDSNGLSRIIAEVHLTAAMNAGVATGYNKMGSITSLNFVFTAIALKSVPTDINPILPNTNIIQRSPKCCNRFTLRNSVKRGRVMISTNSTKIRLLRNFPR